jgi:hypothetical protein
MVRWKVNGSIWSWARVAVRRNGRRPTSSSMALLRETRAGRWDPRDSVDGQEPPESRPATPPPPLVAGALPHASVQFRIWHGFCSTSLDL